MKVDRGKVAVISDLSIDEDLDFGGDYQCGDLASPASGEALRKGNKDIGHAEISDTANIKTTQIVNTALTRALMTAQGDMITRNGSVPKKLVKGTEGHYLRQGASEPGWAALPTVVKIKTADEVVNNSDTLQNDDHLVLAVGANDIWLIHLIVFYWTDSGSVDIDYAFAVPNGGAVRKMETWSLVEDSTFGDGTSESTLDQAGGVKYAQMICLYIGGGTAGNLQLQWAQHIVAVEDTTIYEHSLMLCTKLA